MKQWNEAATSISRYYLTFSDYVFTFFLLLLLFNHYRVLFAILYREIFVFFDLISVKKFFVTENFRKLLGVLERIWF